MKLPYEMAINRIEDKYLAVPKNADCKARTVICCDEKGAYLISLMTEDLTQAQMLEKAKAQFPDIEESALNERVIRVREIIRGLDPENTEPEAIEL